jgi:hypothetical protein
MTHCVGDSCCGCFVAVCCSGRSGLVNTTPGTYTKKSHTEYGSCMRDLLCVWVSMDGGAYTHYIDERTNYYYYRHHT